MPGLGKSGTSRINDFRLSMRPRSDLDLKFSVMLHGGFPLVDSAHVAESWAFAQRRGQIRKFMGWAGGVDFHAPVVQIANVSRKAQRGGCPLGIVAITDALHTAVHAVEPGSLGIAGHGQTRIARSKCDGNRMKGPQPFDAATLQGVQHLLADMKRRCQRSGVCFVVSRQEFPGILFRVEYGKVERVQLHGNGLRLAGLKRHSFPTHEALEWLARRGRKRYIKLSHFGAGPASRVFYAEGDQTRSTIRRERRISKRSVRKSVPKRK